MKLNRIQLIAVLLIFMPLSGCHRDNHGHPELTTGKQLYEHHCAGCHRPDGKGLFLKGYPSIKGGELQSWQIKHKITGTYEDNPDRKMPSFSKMPKAEALLIARYIRSL